MATIVPAVAAGVGAAANYFGGKGAAKAQERSANAALDYQKQLDAEKRANYERSMAEYRQAYDAWDRLQAPRRAMMAASFRHYGINPEAAAGGPPGVSGGSVHPPVAAQPLTLRDLVSQGGGGAPGQAPMAPPPQAQPGLTLGDLANWNDWDTVARRGAR